MGRATSNLNVEQQELLDSGLRMLAHMIASAHIRRANSKTANKYGLPTSENIKLREGYPVNTNPESQHE